MTQRFRCVEFRRGWLAASWLVPPVLCIVIYWHALWGWFQGDDLAWLHLRMEVWDWRGLWHALFAPVDQGTFRPIGVRGFFLVFSTLFGLNAPIFHAWAMLTQLANLMLLNSIVGRITGSRAAGLLAASLWLVNSKLVVAMAWPATYYELLCGFHLLLAFHFLLRHIETGERRYYVYQWIVFLIGFGVMEVNAVYPALAAAYTGLCARRYFRRTLPLFAASLLFLVMHAIWLPKQGSGVYAILLDSTVAGTFRTYWRWALDPTQRGAPGVLDALAGRWIARFGTVALLAFTGWRAWRKQDFLPLFSLMWFGITLAPVLPLSRHVTPYYLTLPVIGISMAAAWGLVVAWRRHLLWGIPVAALAMAFAVTSAPYAWRGARFWKERGLAVERMVEFVAQVRQHHPRGVILLQGVTDDLFWAGVFDNAFAAAGIADVHLAPGSEAQIQSHPGMLPVSDFVFSREDTLRALSEGRAVVCSLEGGEFREITSEYHPPGDSERSQRTTAFVDVGDPRYSEFLGPSWYAADGNMRWMPRSATVHLPGARKAGEKLYVRGYCPASLLARGPIALKVTAAGMAFPPVQVTQPGAPFEFAFVLPPEVAGKPGVAVSLEVDRTFRPPGDGRDLGLAFGTFEIR